MADGKIEFSLGALSFSGEGETGWLSEQLDKVLSVAPKMDATQHSNLPDDPDRHESNGDDNFTDSLATHIRKNNGDTNQVQRFLATADWLWRRGERHIKTSTVSKYLSDNQQKRLANPADCLNKNVSKGYCEKIGNEFLITPEGKKILGY